MLDTLEKLGDFITLVHKDTPNVNEVALNIVSGGEGREKGQTDLVLAGGVLQWLHKGLVYLHRHREPTVLL